MLNDGNELGCSRMWGMSKYVGVVLALITCSALAQTKEKPAGIVIASNGARVRPAGANTPLELATDDYVFSGDTVFTTDQGAAEVVMCAKSVVYSLPAGGEFSIALTEIQPVNRVVPQTHDHQACDLPAMTPDLASARRRALVHQIPPKGDGGQNRLPDLPLGPTYALIVGISEYQKLEKNEWLQFADADARMFKTFLASPRGGSIDGQDRIKLLTNAEATRDAVRNFIRLYLGKARDTHGTFLLVLAAHGFVDDKTRDAHILTNESDPEDLSTSGLPMDELAEVLSEGLAGVGRMLIFVDVCHAAEIRGIRSNLKKNGINGAVQRVIGQVPGQIFSFVSSRETEPSFEGDNWGGGHGAFTYFVLRGLNGEADKNGDGIVSAQELLDYVGSMVKETTRDEQHPKELTVTVENTAPLAQGSKTNFPQPFDQYSNLTKEDLSRSRSRGKSEATTLPSQPSIPAENSGKAEFDSAIRAGRILPGDPQSAYEMLSALFASGSPEYRQAETDLRIALENKGQEAILQYLQGDQVEPKRDSFRDAARYFQAAQTLARDAASVEGRRLFCEGRYAIFDKNYADAIRLLDGAARLDPKGAYSFNALGIAYLEQGRFPLAMAAFGDAIRLAPYWVYPRHNLALTLAEQGQYDLSIRAYREAMKLGPDYSYLPYNLGLLYQRLNRFNEAGDSYQLALKIAQAARDTGLRPAVSGQWQEGAEILNAMGTLEVARGGRSHRDNAEKFYLRARMDDVHSRTARHNLALLLSREGPSVEAEQLWRQNLTEKADDLASRLALARYLDRIGRREEAAREYSAAIGPDGSFPGIRRELAIVYLKLNRTGDARAVLERALLDTPASGPLLEDLGDLETDARQGAKAEERYRAAEEEYKSGTDKARVRKKRQRLAGSQPRA